MIVTGLAGFIFGAMYVYHEYNVWYPIFTHGFVNTVAMLLIYLDVDRRLSDAFF
jgi:membrane protease YdiL (CAAX protease family)